MIEDGNYDSDKLIQSINTSISGSNCLLAYNPVNKKITVTNNSSSSVSIYWYKKDSMSRCENGGGQKVDYNLGWLLGFRQTTYVINNSESITGEAVLNTSGSRYLLLSVDESYQLSINIATIISIAFGHQNVWNMPSYYNKHSMEKDCEQIQEWQKMNLFR